VSCYEAGRRFGQAVLADDPDQEAAALRLLRAAARREVGGADARPRTAEDRRCLQTLEQALWRHAERLRRTGRYQACQRAWAALSQRLPRSSNADKHLYNRAMCANAAGNPLVVIRTLRQLTKRYPRSQLTPRATLLVAQSLRELARYDEAARAFERFASTWPKRKESPDALHFAAALYAGLGAERTLRRAARAFTRRYGKKHPRRAAAVAWLHPEALRQLDEDARTSARAAAAGARTRIRARAGAGARARARARARVRAGARVRALEAWLDRKSVV